MRNLFNFLIKYSVFLLFLILEITALTLLIRNRDYQKSVFLASSNTVISSFYGVSNSVVEFFKLRSANDNLSEENTALINEIIDLKNELAVLRPDSSVTKVNFHIPPEMEYRFISAKVINNSTNKLENYITINKGYIDGIKEDMGVVSEEGVVGIVRTVSKRFAVVIPVLNPKTVITCKFKRSKYSGPLMWKGDDYRYANLNDIARHVEFAFGDTLITSGYTSSFPEGIPVGTIDDFNIKESDPYYNIKVKLAVNFRTLSHVKVIEYLNYDEQRDIEAKSKN